MDLTGARDRLASRALGIVASRALGVVVGFSVVLTAAFVGLVAIVTGETRGVEGRIQFYVLAMAVAFLIALWRLDERGRDGVTILIATSGIAVFAGVLFAIAMEGVIHAIREPGDVLTSSLIVYFFAAAIICTGLGIWGLRHWREFTSNGL